MHQEEKNKGRVCIDGKREGSILLNKILEIIISYSNNRKR